MEMVFPYFVALTGVSVLSITISAIITYRHRERSIIAAALVVVGAAFWLMMDALQLASNSLSIKLFFYVMRFVGLVFVPSGWFVLALLISGYEMYVKPRSIVALSIVPVLTLLLDFTNQSHGLMWSSATLNATDPYLPIDTTSGPGFWVLVVSYSYALILVGLVIFVRRISVSRSSYRAVGTQMLLVSAVPWALNVAYVINRSLFPYFEPSSLAITVAGVLLLWRLVYLPLVNVVPVAHEILVDSLDEGIIVLDGLNRIVDANPKARSFFGRSLSQAGGKSIEAVWAEWPVIRKALDSEAGTGKEVMLGDGIEKRVYEARRSSVEGLLANMPYQLVTLRDITERKRMENNLRHYSERLEELVSERTKKLAESEKKYRQVIEAAQEGLLTYDVNGVVTLVNPCLSKILGYAPEEMVGKKLLTFVDDEDVSSVKAGVERRRLGIADTYEIRLIRKDGSRVYTNATASPITDENGEFTGGLALLSDITERKKLEAQLLESQRLATIGSTAAMVGHDLRNPLQGISTAAYYLKEVEQSKLSKEGKEMLQLITEGVERSDRIIEDLLEYSREIHLELTETDLRSITKDALAHLKIPSVVRLVNSTENEPKLRLDTEKMRRVFLNLLQNAIDAMPDGGTLTITSKISNPNLEIAFKDTGVGMTPETIRKLWSPFHTTKAKGMGLGLAICKRIVEAHGGSICAESALGKGSTFTVRLPTG
jgi:PAS domain S-box-containing protein